MVHVEAGHERVRLRADSWERTVRLGTGTPLPTRRRKTFTLETTLIPAFPSRIKCVLLPEPESGVPCICFHGSVTGRTMAHLPVVGR